jgi:hypothetical protein
MAHAALPCRARAARAGGDEVVTDVPTGLDLPALRTRLLAEREALLGVSAASAESRDPVEPDLRRLRGGGRMREHPLA